MSKLKYFLPLMVAPLVLVAAFFIWRAWLDHADGDPSEQNYLASDAAAFADRPVPGQATPLAKHAFDFSKPNKNHPQEWWYFNTHLFDQDHRRYSLMIAMLKTGQVLGSLTLVNHQVHLPLQYRGPVELRPLQRAVVGPASVLRQTDPDKFEFEFQLRHKVANLTLRMHANKYPLAVGGNGDIDMGEAGRSYYFSLTSMDVEGEGRIRGAPVKLVGRGWMDHQWGNWSDREFNKWYWYSIQLADNTEIMIFEFRRLGEVVSPICDVVLPDGTTRHNLKYEIEPLKTWVSPKTGRSWSLGWKIRIPDIGADLLMKPDLDDQEVTKSLWEGVCKVDGTMNGQPTRGLAFYEARQRTW